VTVLHLGSTHPYEQALTLLLAFGPLVVLAVVIVVRRRQDDEESPLGRGSRRRDAQRER